MTASKATIPDSSKEPGDPQASAAALAAYTDALLAGQTPDPELTPELGATVQRLAQALPPTAAPAELRQRVLRQVRLAWQNPAMQEAPAPLGSRLAEVWRVLKRSLARRPAWAAMATLVIVGALVALLTQGTTEVTGTVTGISPVGWLAFLAVGLLLAGAVFWWSKRR